MNPTTKAYTLGPEKVVVVISDQRRTDGIMTVVEDGRWRPVVSPDEAQQAEIEECIAKLGREIGGDIKSLVGRE